jgi:hypothetical protein
MMGRLSVLCVCAFGALVACGGESSSPGTAGGGSEAVAGAGAIGGSGTIGVSGAGAGVNAGGGAAGTRSTGSGGATGGTGTIPIGGTAGIGASTGSGGALDMSDPGSGSCTAFTPCGGALVGTWQFNSICVSPPLTVPLANCSTAQYALTANGSFGFGADGSIDVSNAKLAANLLIPPSCITGATTCASFGSCVSTPNGGCECSSPTTTTQAQAETYVVSGDHFTVTNLTAGTAQTIYYCVNGTRLLMRGRSSTSAYVYDLTRQ